MYHSDLCNDIVLKEINSVLILALDSFNRDSNKQSEPIAGTHLHWQHPVCLTSAFKRPSVPHPHLHTPTASQSLKGKIVRKHEWHNLHGNKLVLKKVAKNKYLLSPGSTSLARGKDPVPEISRDLSRCRESTAETQVRPEVKLWRRRFRKRGLIFAPFWSHRPTLATFSGASPSGKTRAFSCYRL